MPRKKKEAKKSEGYSQEAYLKTLETRLPGGKRTKRLPVLKLELGGGEPANGGGVSASVGIP